MVLLFGIFQLKHNPLKDELLRLLESLYPCLNVGKAFKRLLLTLGKRVG